MAAVTRLRPVDADRLCEVYVGGARIITPCDASTTDKLPSSASTTGEPLSNDRGRAGNVPTKDPSHLNILRDGTSHKEKPKCTVGCKRTPI